METLSSFLRRVSEGRDEKPVHAFEDGLVLLVTDALQQGGVCACKLVESVGDHLTVSHHQALLPGQTVLVVSPTEEILTEVVRSADIDDAQTSELHILRRRA